MAPEYIERFWSKVSIGEKNDCWEWNAGKFNNGYGAFSVDGKMKLSHRVAYELTTGPIQPGMYCCHKCDNPTCCNPNHLFLGTPAENMNDRDGKGRQSSKLSESQVLEIRSLYSTGNHTQKELADRFGVGPRQISYIVNRQSWSHI